MDRKYYQDLLNWKKRDNRKPLVIRGGETGGENFFGAAICPRPIWTLCRNQFRRNTGKARTVSTWEYRQNNRVHIFGYRYTYHTGQDADLPWWNTASAENIRETPVFLRKTECYPYHRCRFFTRFHFGRSHFFNARWKNWIPLYGSHEFYWIFIGPWQRSSHFIHRTV